MLIPLPEVLDLPSFRMAGATPLTGTPDQAMVRWVHSSEVFEMGSLLAGGEVLLTSGLGLHGRTATQLAAYVDQVADAGCVAIALELGRSLFAVPASMVEAAQRRDLVLITLTAVVPFERMVEDFHDLLLRRQLGGTRTGEPQWRDFLAVVVAGDGLRALLDAVARTAGCVAELQDTEGQLIERSRISTVSAASATVETEVRTATGSAGTLVLRGRPSRARVAVAERAAVAVALELGRHPGAGDRPSAAQSVVTDLAAGVLVARTQVERRLGDLGWPLGDGRHVLVAAVDAEARYPARELADRVHAAFAGLGELAVPPLVGVVGSHVVVLLHGWTSPMPRRFRALLEAAADALEASASGPGLVIGAAGPVSDLADVTSAVREARDVVRSVRRSGLGARVVLARDVGVQRLLINGVDPRVLADFVAEQIGVLIDHDRAHASDLVRTLDLYLEHGASKAATSRALGIRRQSLYARLTRIERLLGASLTDPHQVAGVSLALTGWRIRTGLDPQSSFPTRGPGPRGAARPG